MIQTTRFGAAEFAVSGCFLQQVHWMSCLRQHHTRAGFRSVVSQPKVASVLIKVGSVS